LPGGIHLALQSRMKSVRLLTTVFAILTTVLLVTMGGSLQAQVRLPAQASHQAASQVPVSAMAQVQTYFDQFGTSGFNVSLSLADFQKLPPHLREIALADLIAQVDYTFDGERGEQSYQAKDRELILQTYYQGLSSAQKEQIQAWAFDFSLYYSNSPE